jgi:transcriptional regulator with XRE-family HTH domain
MKPSFPSISVRQSLRKLGEDIRQARLVRRIPMALLAERAMISRATLTKIQKGDPSVAMGSYAQVIFGLGFKTPFNMLLDITNDSTALSILGREIPQRVRIPKEEDNTARIRRPNLVCLPSTGGRRQAQGTSGEEDNKPE